MSVLMTPRTMPWIMSLVNIWSNIGTEVSVTQVSLVLTGKKPLLVNILIYFCEASDLLDLDINQYSSHQEYYNFFF